MVTAPYGAWESPISAMSVTRAALRFSDSLEVDGGDLYWTESRPAEGGRTVVVRRRAAGAVADVTPPGRNARTRVHEYGGGAYAVRDGVVYFAEFADQRLYRHRPGEEPRPITPEPALPAGLRYADFTFGDGFLICVGERHGLGRGLERTDPPASRRFGAPPGDRRRPRLLLLAAHLPRRPPSGLAGLGPPRHALERHHPVAGPAVTPRAPRARPVPWPGAGGSRSSSRSGRPTGCSTSPRTAAAGGTSTGSESGEARPVAAVAGDAGVPQWVFRLRRYAFLGDGSIAAVYSSPAGTSLADPRRRRDGPGPARPGHLAGGPGGRRRRTSSCSPVHPPPSRRWCGWTRPPATRRCSAPRRGPASTPPSSPSPNWWSSPPPTGRPTPTTTRRRTPASRRPRRPAPAAGHHPRRPHRRRPAGAGPRGAVLDQPRLRPGRRGLRRVHRLRPGLLGAAARHLGPGRRAGLRPGRRPPGRHRPRRPGPPGHPRRQRRGLHHPGRPGLPRRVRRRSQPLRRGRPGVAGPRHPQVRVALPRLAGRALSRGRRRPTGSAPPSITWRASTAR